jgi:hypothetical protein
MTGRSILRPALRWGGRLLTLLGLVFVGLRLRAYWNDLDLAGGGMSLLYGAAAVMLALAWRQLLARFGAATSHRWAVGVYGLSQIS